MDTAAETEATVLNILHHYPDQIDEDTVVDVKRDIYNGLRRVYRESFIYMYEDKKSFEQMLDAVLIVEAALKKLPTKKKSDERNYANREESRRRPRVRAKQIWRRARTGLEPEVVVYINNQPHDAILNLCTVTVHSFICDVPQTASLRSRELHVAVSKCNWMGRT